MCGSMRAELLGVRKTRTPRLAIEKLVDPEVKRNYQNQLVECLPDDDDSGDDNGICDTSLDALVKMFPQVCRKQLKQCLQVADGDLGKAVNLALDRAEQVTTDKAQGPPTDRGQVTSSMSPNLPDNEPNESVSTLSAEERISMLERYGIVQAERTGSLCPAPYTAAEPKSTVRYLDGKVVDTKGKKYIEIKPEYPNMPQPQFLKALRRYKKH
ncbi:CUE domain-containing protein 2-B [Clonorchis sinensis]|uniref:CUE domain-containing protein 2-B n=1 Tax=Clonorchis sinensis TaxID=79923 RepID=G7Y6W6_CLOSI|nr:CUE domain-containing protein 2-B [Clonorchis sinensis]